jgi:predicted PurR-regulated permease PerM
VSLFLAMGLNPAVVWLTNQRLPYWAAVVVFLPVVVAFVGVVVAAAIGPVSREMHELQVNFPKWRRQVTTARDGALIAIPVAAGIHLVLEEVAYPSLDRR